MPLFGVALCAHLMGADPRNFRNGRLIPDESYCDQPSIVVTHDGNWLCTLTTGAGREGAGGQHVVATISSDQGRTWSPLIDIEPATGPSASWVIPFQTTTGRVYALYNYNGDRTIVPQFAHVKHRRDDTLGWYVYRCSDDQGRTWSERHRLPMPVAGVHRIPQSSHQCRVSGIALGDFIRGYSRPFEGDCIFPAQGASPLFAAFVVRW